MKIIPFENYLRGLGRSEPTIRIYRGHVNRLLQNPETGRRLLLAPEEAKAAILQCDAAIPTRQRYTFRSAIRAFNAFLTSTGRGAILPEFPTALPAPPQNHPLSPLLSRLSRESRIPWDVVEILRWKHLRGLPSSNFWTLDDPGDRQSYRVPSEVLREINSWAGGGKRPPLDTPLVPREPLSPIPMAASMLKALARG